MANSEIRSQSRFVQDAKEAFIGGEWVNAKNGKTFPVYEPSSTEVLGHVADMSRADFVRAIEIADKGFRKYSTSTTFAERGIQLRKWFDLVHANVDDCIKYFPIVLTGSGKDSES